MSIVKIIIAVVVFIAVAAAAAGAAFALIVLRRGSGSTEKTVSAGIARHAKLYDGLYEGLCQILARNEVMDRDTLKEWCGRTSRIENEPAYTAAFNKLFGSATEAPENEYRKKLALLLKLIAEAGITRIDVKSVTFDAEVKRSYIYLGEGTPSAGEVYNVLKPCWIFEGQTVEQGIISKGEIKL